MVTKHNASRGRTVSTESSKDIARGPESPRERRSSLPLVLFVSLVLVSILALMMTGQTRPGSDHTSAIVVLVGIGGLLSSIGFRKSSFRFLLFATCGLLLGFVLAAALSTLPSRRISEPPSIFTFSFVWLLYAFAFVVLGRFASRKRVFDGQKA